MTAAGRAALESWLRSGLGTDPLPPRLNRLFPLLAEATRRVEAPVERGVRSRLRAALASEEVRYEAYIRVLAPTLAALAQGGMTAIVLKGAALAETSYPRPALRHSHDIDLLLAPEERAEAIACLRQHGWSSAGGAPDSGTDTLVHRFGLPLGVHTRLIRSSLPTTDFERLRARVRPLELAGVPALMLSRPDTLLHILGQAVGSGGFSALTWACDAFFCVAAGGSFDCSVFAGDLRQTPLAPAYAELLCYLRDELDVAVPSSVGESARRASPLPWQQREALVASLDAGAFGRRRMWARSRSWPTRLVILKWLLLPSGTVARAVAPGIPPWQLPLRNLRRALG